MEEKTKINSKKTGKQTRKIIVIAGISGFICATITALVVSAVFYLSYVHGDESRNQQRQTVVKEGEVIADISAELSPSVVSVRTTQTAQEQSIYGQSGQEISQGAGTGIIVNKDGLVLTNKHVIPAGTSKVEVTLSDGTVYKGVDILGRDPLNDLALLQINNAKSLTPAKLGDSDSVKVGEKVIAIGNALGEFQNTVTSGIISGLGRPIEASDGNGSSEQLNNLFQTDAAINPGNSGGPLVNFNGEVIGINTAIAEGAEGLGFSIPINEAKSVINSAEETGKISRAYLGVQYTMVTPEISKQLKLGATEGAYISKNSSSVVSGSPADKAGLKPGDVIIQVNNTKLTQNHPLSSVVGQLKVGDQVKIVVSRDGQLVTLNATLAEAPTK